MLTLLASLALAAPAEDGASETVEAPTPAESTAPSLPDREDRSDFLQGDLDLHIGLCFDGVEPAPWTLFTSLAGWNALQITLDYAVLTSDEATVSLGLEAYYSRPVLQGALRDTLFNDAGFNDVLEWRTLDRGAMARASLHVTSFSSVDPYGAFLVGPSFYSFEADVLTGANAGTTARLDAAGLRLGAAGGLVAVAENDFLGGIELRYLVTARFSQARRIVIGEGSVNEQQFDLSWRHRGPSGFGWTFFVGHRF